LSRTQSTCSDCGAPLPDSGVCRVYFYELLALESQVPGAAGEVAHFFAVASYNLQHPSQFVPEALAGLRTAVADALAGEATIPELRRRAGAAAQGRAPVIRRDGAPDATLGAWPTQWPMTVRDVCEGSVDEYAQRVRSWAASVSATLDRALPPPAR
jgi:hypothetical protein